MATIHLSLQGKGGVGKSFLALMIAMYYQEKNIPLSIFDTDPINSTVYSFRSLKAQKFEIMNKDNIDKRSFDKLFSTAIESENDVLIDIGSNGFISLCSYILSNELIQMLYEAGHRVIIHTSIVGGQNFIDTVNGFDALANQFPSQAEFVIWLNPFWGQVIYDNKNFDDLKTYKTHKARISAIINIPELDAALHGKDLTSMLEEKITFYEIRTINDPESPLNNEIKQKFDLFTCHRLNQISKGIYAIIEQSRIA